MHTDSSARRTYFASESASEWTTTVLMPSSRQARWMRRAISPRLAIKPWSNNWPAILLGTRASHRPKSHASHGIPDHGSQVHASADDDKGLPVLDRLPVLDQDRFDDTRLVSLDLVHQLHRLDNAQRVARLNCVANFHERSGPGRCSPVEGPDHRCFHDVTFGRRRRKRRPHLASRNRGACAEAARIACHRLMSGRHGTGNSHPLFTFRNFEFGDTGALDELDQFFQLA